MLLPKEVTAQLEIIKCNYDLERNQTEGVLP